MSKLLQDAQARAWTVWTVATGLVTALALFGFRGDTSDEGLIELGFIFAGYVVSMGVISGRAKDVTTLMVIVWGGTMGMWCNRWFEMCAHWVDEYLPRLGIFSPQVLDAMDLPLAVAGAGIMSAGLLLIATRSTRVTWSCIGASLACAVVPMLSSDPSHTLPWAAVAWNAITAGALSVWAVDEAVRRGGGRCKACGTDVHGLTSPVCPRCAAPLTTCAVAKAAGFEAMKQRRPV